MPESIGGRLKREREARRLTIEKAAEATRLRPHYLQALENDDYSVMSSAAQGRGFLRLYTEFLELNLDEMLSDMKVNVDSTPDAPPVPAVSATPAPAPLAEPTPASPPDGKAGRGGFWARLLRKSVPAAPAEEESKPQAEATPAPAHVAVEEAASEPVKPARKSSTAKKTKPTKPGEEKPKTTRRSTKPATGKKKTVVEPEAVELLVAPAVEEPPSVSIPEPEIQIEVSPPAESEEFQPQWWERVRARVGYRLSKPRQPEVEEEAAAVENVEPERVEPEPAAPVLPSTETSGTRFSSDDLFAGIGAELRTRRTALNLTREEIERHIRVRAHYLRAMEEGDFDSLPSAVQMRGMLSNYAAFLDLDVEALLLRFANVLQVRHRERHPLPPGARGKVQPAIPSNLPPLRGFVAADLLGIGLLVMLVAFTVWGISRVMQARNEVSAEPTSPSISEILLASTELPTQPAAATSALLDIGNLTTTPLATEEPAATPTFPEGVTVQINLVAVERTFLRVIVDGDIAFDGRVTPGTAYPFEAKERIEVLAGNGAALRITFNSRDLGFLGGFGEVVNLIYTGSGIITPTATIAPTPTITATPTITPSPTKTIVPSPTPRP